MMRGPPVTFPASTENHGVCILRLIEHYWSIPRRQLPSLQIEEFQITIVTVTGAVLLRIWQMFFQRVSAA